MKLVISLKELSAMRLTYTEAVDNGIEIETAGFSITKINLVMLSL